jgi:hypothetical protein
MSYDFKDRNLFSEDGPLRINEVFEALGAKYEVSRLGKPVFHLSSILQDDFSIKKHLKEFERLRNGGEPEYEKISLNQRLLFSYGLFVEKQTIQLFSKIYKPENLFGNFKCMANDPKKIRAYAINKYYPLVDLTSDYTGLELNYKSIVGNCDMAIRDFEDGKLIALCEIKSMGVWPWRKAMSKGQPSDKHLKQLYGYYVLAQKNKLKVSKNLHFPYWLREYEAGVKSPLHWFTVNVDDLNQDLKACVEKRIEDCSNVKFS